MRLALAIVLAGGLLQDGATQPAEFRAETYAVPIEISVYKGRVWCRGSDPETGLTVKDFAVSIDKRGYPLTEAKEDPEKPGRYLLYFNPPESLRDGKPHRIDIYVQKRGSASVTPFVMQPPGTEAKDKPGPVCCQSICKGL
jgi:hypothetical protein